MRPGICERTSLSRLMARRITAAGPCLGHSQHFRDLARRKLLEVFQSQHLAIHGIHVVQSFLHDQSSLGLDGRF